MDKLHPDEEENFEKKVESYREKKYKRDDTPLKTLFMRILLTLIAILLLGSVINFFFPFNRTT